MESLKKDDAASKSGGDGVPSTSSHLGNLMIDCCPTVHEQGGTIKESSDCGTPCGPLSEVGDGDCWSDACSSQRFSSPNPSEHEEGYQDKKVKRRRMQSVDVASGGGGAIGSGTPKSASSRLAYPLSERQQMALLLQMTATDSGGTTPGESPRSPLSTSVGGVTPTSGNKPKGRLPRVHKRNEHGETPLHIAAIRGDHRLCRRLIEEGADVNAADYAGWAPLHEAANHGSYESARVLIRHGAIVNVCAVDNDTPLHDAASNGCKKLVLLLLKHGADPERANAKGEKAADVCDDEDIRKILTGSPSSWQAMLTPKTSPATSPSPAPTSDDSDADETVPDGSVSSSGTGCPSTTVIPDSIPPKDPDKLNTSVPFQKTGTELSVPGKLISSDTNETINSSISTPVPSVVSGAEFTAAKANKSPPPQNLSMAAGSTQHVAPKLSEESSSGFKLMTNIKKVKDHDKYAALERRHHKAKREHVKVHSRSVSHSDDHKHHLFHTKLGHRKSGESSEFRKVSLDFQTSSATSSDHPVTTSNQDDLWPLEGSVSGPSFKLKKSQSPRPGLIPPSTSSTGKTMIPVTIQGLTGVAHSAASSSSRDDLRKSNFSGCSTKMVKVSIAGSGVNNREPVAAKQSPCGKVEGGSTPVSLTRKGLHEIKTKLHAFDDEGKMTGSSKGSIKMGVGVPDSAVKRTVQNESGISSLKKSFTALKSKHDGPIGSSGLSEKKRLSIGTTSKPGESISLSDHRISAGSSSKKRRLADVYEFHSSDSDESSPTQPTTMKYGKLQRTSSHDTMKGLSGSGDRGCGGQMATSASSGYLLGAGRSSGSSKDKLGPSGGTELKKKWLVDCPAALNLKPQPVLPHRTDRKTSSGDALMPGSKRLGTSIDSLSSSSTRSLFSVKSAGGIKLSSEKRGDVVKDKASFLKAFPSKPGAKMFAEKEAIRKVVVSGIKPTPLGVSGPVSTSGDETSKVSTPSSSSVSPAVRLNLPRPAPSSQPKLTSVQISGQGVVVSTQNITGSTWSKMPESPAATTSSTSTVDAINSAKATSPISLKDSTTTQLIANKRDFTSGLKLEDYKSADLKESRSPLGVDTVSEDSGPTTCLKVPPLRIVFPSSTRGSGDNNAGNVTPTEKVSLTCGAIPASTSFGKPVCTTLPYVVTSLENDSDAAAIMTTVSSTSVVMARSSETTGEVGKGDGLTVGTTQANGDASGRITRSKVRLHGFGAEVRGVRGYALESADFQSSISNYLHPRKRKLQAAVQQIQAGYTCGQGTLEVPEGLVDPGTQRTDKVDISALVTKNSFEGYRDLRKQVLGPCST